MRPRIGFAALKLLREAGVSPVVPPSQTCCGQPAYNNGYRAQARILAKKCAKEFADCDRVVVPSGSCAGMFRRHYPQLFSDDESVRESILEFAAKCRELTEFLAEINFSPAPVEFDGAVAYHDSCAGLRELGVKESPRRLLKSAGIPIKEMTECEECCGFGGTFSVKFGEVSSKMAARKCRRIRESGAAAAAMGDLGCILNIEGRLRREGDEATRILHIAEILAGDC